MMRMKNTFFLKTSIFQLHKKGEEIPRKLTESSFYLNRGAKIITVLYIYMYPNI